MTDNMEDCSIGVFTTRNVFLKRLELDLIIYDDEGDWQFLNTTEDLKTANAFVVSMEEILSLNVTLSDVIERMSNGTFAIKFHGEWEIHKST